MVVHHCCLSFNSAKSVTVVFQLCICQCVHFIFDKSLFFPHLNSYFVMLNPRSYIEPLKCIRS